jgi:uroporphyrinogen decarboxylase
LEEILTMTSKERVIAALKHIEPDRVPTGENQIDGYLVEQILGHPTLYNTGWKELEALWDGRRDAIVQDYCTAHVETVQALDWDYIRVPVVPPAGEYQRPHMTGKYSWIDERGDEVHMNPDAGNIIIRSHFPDMRIDDLPDPDEPFEIDPTQLDALRYVVRELGDTHFIIGRSPIDGTFPWELTVGMEKFLMAMITDPEFVRRAAEVYVNRSIEYIKAMLDLGVDAVMTVDDYSDNRGPIMGKKLFQKFILPGIQRQCAAVHELGGYFIKHTDGNVWSILDDLVEIGIDGWHGIQTNIGMDLALLKERYGEKLCFFGGANCETLIAGTPEEVCAEVRYAIHHAAPGGGLIVTNSNVVQPGSRLENYTAMRQAVRDYGRYPISVSE